MPTFYLGLCLIVVGTGLLKPNVSAMVGDLYPEGGARRDAGFSIFYSGINTGALFGPIVCGYLGEKVNWHLGFGAAGIGMVFGLMQYRLGGKYLGTAGLRTAETGDRNAVKHLGYGVLAFVVAAGLLAALNIAGVLRVTLGVTATPWLERILLQLGPAAQVVTLDPRLGGADLAAAAADRVLARYDRSGRAG